MNAYLEQLSRAREELLEPFSNEA